MNEKLTRLKLNRLKLIFSFLIFSNLLFSQSIGKLDSLRISLKDSSTQSSILWHFRIADKYYTKHELRDSQRVNIIRGMTIAESIKDTFNLAGGNLDLGYMQMKRRNHTKADSFFNVAYSLHESINSYKGMGMVLLAKGNLAEREGKGLESIEHIVSAMGNFEKAKDRRGVIACLASIAHEYVKMKKYRAAIGYYKIAYAEMNQVLSASQASNVLYAYAHCYWDLYEDTENRLFLDTAYQIAQEGITLTKKKGLLYWGLKFKGMEAGYALENGNYISAIEQSKYMVSEAHRIKRPRILTDAFSLLSQAHLKSENYLQAIRFADSLKYYAELNKSYEIVRGALEKKYLAYKKLGNYKRAITYLEEFKLLSDSIMNVEGIEKIKEVEQKYVSEKQEKEILALSQESEKLKQATLLKQEEVKSKNLLLLTLGLLILVGITAFYIFYQRKILSEKKRSEEIQQQLWRAQINPHFLFNALNSIQRFYVEGKTEQGNDYLADFGDLLRKILNRSTKATVSVTEEVEFLKLYIDLEKRRLNKPLNYSIKLSDELKDFEYQIPALLLQPIVENAIRHGIAKGERDGEMNIIIDKVEDGIRITISDNGIGFSQSLNKSKRIHRSLGLELVKERVDKIGDFNIEEIQAEDGGIKGTEVQIFINTTN